MVRRGERFMTGSGELELPGESGSAKGSGMEVTIQSVILVVGDLGHSIEFYSGLLSGLVAWSPLSVLFVITKNQMNPGRPPSLRSAGRRKFDR
jgi:hypothetical protein